MDEETQQMRQVAEAARALWEHESTILEILRRGDYELKKYHDRTAELRSDLNTQLLAWRDLRASEG